MRIRQYDDNSDLVAKLLLFIFSPFLSFLCSLSRPGSKSSYIIYFLFGIVFAWHMDSRNPNHYDDFLGIVERFKATNYSTQEMINCLINFFSFSEDAPKEIFEIVLIWFSKLIADNYHIYFALASIFYLLFMLKSMKFITSDKKFQGGFWGVLIMALFYLPRDIITIQNPRFVVGFWFNVMCTLIYFFDDKKTKYIYALLIVLSPIFHSGMWFYVGAFLFCVLFISLFKNDKFYIILFYLTIPFSFLSYEVLSQFDFSVLPLPSKLSQSINIYLSDETYSTYIKQSGKSGFWWVQAIFDWLTILSYSLIPLFVIRKRTSCIVLRQDISFFRYFLLFCSIVNFIQTIPVLGFRYYYFFRVFAIIVWFKYVFPRHNKYLLFILLACSFSLFMRYFYNGAVSVCVPPGIWWEPLPWLIFDGL